MKISSKTQKKGKKRDDMPTKAKLLKCPKQQNLTEREKKAAKWDLKG